VWRPIAARRARSRHDRRLRWSGLSLDADAVERIVGGVEVENDLTQRIRLATPRKSSN
jgi:hypothetical protein